MTLDTEVRDQLALDRTHLANERTLLAYVSTALALIGAGAAVLQFVDAAPSQAGGWVLLCAGFVLLPVGVLRFVSVRRRLRGGRRPAP